MVRKRTKYKTILSTNMQRTDQPRKEGNSSLRSYISVNAMNWQSQKVKKSSTIEITSRSFHACDNC